MDWPRGRAPHRSDSFESYEASDEESEVHHSLGKVFPEKPSLSSPTSLFSANNSGTWRMLYCGCAKPVSDALTAISKGLGISFRKESFAW